MNNHIYCIDYDISKECSDNLIWPGTQHTNMPDLDISEKDKTKILKWLTESGFKITNNSNPKVKFDISFENMRGRRFGIIHPNNINDEIVLLSGANLTDNQKAILNGMGKGQKDNLIWDLNLGLLSTGVEFYFVGKPMESIQVQKKIYHDGLNKNLFMEKVQDIYNSIRYIFLVLDKHLGANNQLVKEPATEDLNYIL